MMNLQAIKEFLLANGFTEEQLKPTIPQVLDDIGNGLMLSLQNDDDIGNMLIAIMTKQDELDARITALEGGAGGA